MGEILLYVECLLLAVDRDGEPAVLEKGQLLELQPIGRGAVFDIAAYLPGRIVGAVICQDGISHFDMRRGVAVSKDDVCGSLVVEASVSDFSRAADGREA